MCGRKAGDSTSQDSGIKLPSVRGDRLISSACRGNPNRNLKIVGHAIIRNTIIPLLEAKRNAESVYMYMYKQFAICSQ